MHDRQSSTFWSNPGQNKLSSVIADNVRKMNSKPQTRDWRNGHKCTIVSPHHFDPILGMSTVFKSVVYTDHLLQVFLAKLVLGDMLTDEV